MNATEWVNNWKVVRRNGLKWTWRNRVEGLTALWDVEKHVVTAFQGFKRVERQTIPHGTLRQYFQYLERNYGRRAR